MEKPKDSNEAKFCKRAMHALRMGDPLSTRDLYDVLLNMEMIDNILSPFPQASGILFFIRQYAHTVRGYLHARGKEVEWDRNSINDIYEIANLFNEWENNHELNIQFEKLSNALRMGAQASLLFEETESLWYFFRSKIEQLPEEHRQMSNVIDFPQPNEDPNHDVVAAGPIIMHDHGMTPLRVVLRDISEPGRPKYVVHDELFNEKTGGHVTFNGGDYFGNPSKTAGELFTSALEKFFERVNRYKSEYAHAANEGKLRRVTTKYSGDRK